LSLRPGGGGRVCGGAPPRPFSPQVALGHAPTGPSPLGLPAALRCAGDMNSALSVWQLVIIAVVPLAALCGWIITVFMVAREPRAPAATAASSAAPVLLAAPDSPGQDQPVDPPARRLAA